MDWLSVIVWLAGTLIVVLGPIIVIHELGHFISAKAAGVRVEEFGLGYPPRLLKVWRGKGYLVVGGTRILIPRRFKLPPRADVGSWVSVLAREREDGLYEARQLTLLNASDDELISKTEQTGPDVRISGEVSRLDPGTIYSLNLLPVGAFVRMMGEEDPSHPQSLAAQPKRRRIAVMASGAILNLVFALLLLMAAYVSGLPERWLVQIDSVEPGTAAAAAGLQQGDLVLAVDGARLTSGDEEFRGIILESPGDRLQLLVKRDGREVTLSATPGQGPEGSGYLGVYMVAHPDTDSLRHYSAPEALRAAAGDIAAVVAIPFRLPRMLSEGQVTPEQIRPSSMVGISGFLTLFLQQSLAWRWAFPILHTAGLISLSLGITNLLPIPALDGGRILFVLIEAVRGRRISPEREAVVHVVGLVILIGLMAIVMIQDVINPVIPWAWLQR
jgi:regulator of sigma E protease